MGESGQRRERLVLFALVVIGGCLGTFARAGVSAQFPAPVRGWPWTTFSINLTGALSLGLLLGVLSRLGGDSGARRRARLGLGTGVLGGFTTYSTFAVEVVERQQDSQLMPGFGYALASVIGGVLLAGVGLRVGRGGTR